MRLLRPVLAIVLVACAAGAPSRAQSAPADPDAWRRESHEPPGFTPLTDRDFSHKASADRDRGPRGSQGWDGIEFRAHNLTLVEDPTAPHSPPMVAQMRYPAGMKSGRAPGLAQLNIRARERPRSLYVSMWVKLSPNFHGNQTGTNKIFHFWIQHDNPGQRSKAGNRIFLSAEGKAKGPLHPQVRLQGVPDERARITPRGGATIRRGAWQRWELLLELNTPGVADGRARWWIDGRLATEADDLLVVAAEETGRFQGVQFSPTYGGGGRPVPEEMFLWLDHVYVSGK